MQNGTPFNIPLQVDLHIDKFSGGTIIRCESCATNLVYDQYPDNRWFTTQRPGINVVEDCSDTVADLRGRGAYYWDAVSEKYIVNAATVYQSSYGGSTMSITTGTGRVFMGEVGTSLAIIDADNDEGWYIAAGAPTTIVAISAAGFTGLTLARGGAVINGKLYVGSTDGTIAECDVEDVTTWNTLNQVSAEISPDGLVAITEHEQHVVAFGNRTIEFFSQNNSPTGSTLTARQDIDYDIGLVSGDTFCRVGDSLFFLGFESGSISVYEMAGFVIRKISKETMDTFLTSAVNLDNVGVTLSGGISGGRAFVFLTTHVTTTDLDVQQTLVYSARRPFWGLWDTDMSEFDHFPMVDWMPDTTARHGEGILINGDLVNFYDDNNPQDTVAASSIYESGVFEDGIYSSTVAAGTEISFEVITGTIDGGTPRTKRAGDLWLVGNPVETSDTVTVSISDDEEIATNTYNAAGTIDVADSGDRLNRMGRFRRRNHKVTGTLAEQIKMEALQTTVRTG